MFTGRATIFVHSCPICPEGTMLCHRREAERMWVCGCCKHEVVDTGMQIPGSTNAIVVADVVGRVEVMG